MGGNGGTNNNSANGRTVSWQKSKRIKSRVSKKRAGVKESHAKAVKAASGARTKKSQRKVERRHRLNAKELAALEGAMEIDAAPAAKKTKKAKKPKAAAATEPAPMQE